ncbi:Serine/threonine-protein kinase [Rhypophila decipiens]|uniref:Serine/threonine-protein kinase n=1 Tax=Rhypophila decipiens TaxID=261697 RepID=A0AAN6Y4I6_9PEZI|nr:Serine/threonine-protein kinase [Rhypophila decipiens]
MLHLPRACQIQPTSWRRVPRAIITISSPVLFPNSFRNTYSTVAAENGNHVPVHIDARLNDNRYRVVHLLGQSSFSTVWLAHDNLTSRYVAVKVCTADSDAANRESEVLSRLGSVAMTTQHAGKSMIPTLRDLFTVSGPNGHHICLVSEPTRGSLEKARTPAYHPFPLDVVRSLAAQLALAVSFIHSQGLVHGDIRVNNALVGFSPSACHINNLSVPELYAKYGAPLAGNIDSPNGIAPIDLFIPANELTLPQARLVLSDFRSSFDEEKEVRYQSHAPVGLHPPDLFLPPYPTLNFASDIWSLGAAIFEEYIIAEKALQANGLNRIDAHGKRIIPTDWWDTNGYMNHLDWDPEDWDRHGYEFGCDWRYESGLSEIDTLESQLHYRVLDPRGNEIGEEEFQMILSMLRTLLAFKGADRPNAEGVLELEWMRKYALPAYEEARRVWD